MTKNSYSLGFLFVISTHTLTWSVTSRLQQAFSIDTFQLTRSRGAWLLIPLTALHASEFQLTRSRGAWHNSAVSLAWEWKFQLTRSRGAWPMPAEVFSLPVKFQLTRSRGAWHWSYCIIMCKGNFNSHAHVERDFLLYKTNILMIKFQLTRSRGAWPIRIQGRYGWMSISTHTLTWSVTRGKSSRVVRWTNFNSHAHVERDINNNNLNTIRFISTHTLTWSVTPT